MEKQNEPGINKFYLGVVIVLMVVLPSLSAIIEILLVHSHTSLHGIVGKWFIFWAIGIRLFTAGLRQIVKPSFTAKSIFHITDKESFIVVKELGFANICLGAIGIISLFLPDWRMASAFSGGLFMGIAGINHLIKKPVSVNEWIAMASDIFIAVIMLAYIIL